MYHISGKSVFIPSQLYTLRMANQNLPQEGMPTAPPVTEQDNTEAEQFDLIQWDTLHMNIHVTVYISAIPDLCCVKYSLPEPYLDHQAQLPEFSRWYNSKLFQKQSTCLQCAWKINICVHHQVIKFPYYPSNVRH